MFRCDVPPLSEREQVSRAGCYVSTETDSHHWAPPGSTVKKAATIGYSKLFGVGAIYSMTPCDEAAALRAVEELQPRSLMLVSLPAGKSLAAAEIDAAIDPYDGDSDLCADCGKPLEVCQLTLVLEELRWQCE